MRFKGKLIGALLGSLAGPLGTVLGGLLGHLFDRAAEDELSLESLRGADTITAAQLAFLASLIGLSVAVADHGGEARPIQLAALKGFFRKSFPYPEEDQKTLEGIIEESFRRRRELDITVLSRNYRDSSSPGGRLLLLRLLFKITTIVPAGPSAEQLEVIRTVAAELAVEPEVVQTLEAEFLYRPQESAADTLSPDQAYAILGIPPEASDEALRHRYRRMAAQHHPDRVANLGEEFVAVAEEKFKLIRQAYELIERERGSGSRRP
jgi:DnaJ like chaperone protein